MVKMQTPSNLQLQTRWAPTPSGYLHTGNAINFILTWLIARLQNGKIRLRIDDLDRERTRPEYLDDVFDKLNWLGLDWDEGPLSAKEHASEYSQVKRLDLYHEALQKLKNQNYLYACVCSRTSSPMCSCMLQNLSLDTLGCSWNLKIPDDHMIKFNDLKLIQPKFELSTLMPRLVLRKKNGDPAYQIGSLCDDILYNINLIVRGEDLLPSTVVQLYLAECLGLNKFKAVTFLHHRLIRDNEGEKLSKSAGSTSLEYMKSNHLTPAGIYQLVSKLLDLPVCTSANKLLDAARQTGFSNLSFRDV